MDKKPGTVEGLKSDDAGKPEPYGLRRPKA